MRTILGLDLPQQHIIISLFTGDINQARYSDTRWVWLDLETAGNVPCNLSDHSSAVTDFDRTGQDHRTGHGVCSVWCGVGVITENLPVSSSLVLLLCRLDMLEMENMFCLSARKLTVVN